MVFGGRRCRQGHPQMYMPLSGSHWQPATHHPIEIRARHHLTLLSLRGGDTRPLRSLPAQRALEGAKLRQLAAVGAQLRHAWLERVRSGSSEGPRLAALWVFEAGCTLWGIGRGRLSGSCAGADHHGQRCGFGHGNARHWMLGTILAIPTFWRSPPQELGKRRLHLRLPG